MKLKVKIEGRTREVEAAREGGRIRWRLDGQAVEADALKVAEETYSILLGGQAFEVSVRASADGLLIHAGGQEFSAAILDPRQWQGRHGHTVEVEGRLQILAPMPGKIVKILVRDNQKVSQGDGLLVIEAMKMQNELRAPRDGRVERVYVNEGAGVEAGFKLLRLV